MRFKMKKLLVLPLLYLLTFSLTAQTYDISQYRARFERRPFLELNPQLSYNSLFSSIPNQDRHSGGAGLNVGWRESYNQDNRILNWTAVGQASFFRQEFEDPDLFDVSQRNVLLQASLEDYRYYQPNRFWGIRVGAGLSHAYRLDFNQVSIRSTNINLNPGIFAGSGRIEFAEDALLANWMMDDLLEAGVIDAPTPEQRLALAQRITSIIGNRTFDFRRRRIYELQQLNTLFAEEGIATQDDFLLFAILNDNWAFANRATLPHGKRIQYGIDANTLYSYNSTPISFDQFFLSGRPYLNFQHAQIRHNNASTVLEVEIGAFYEEVLDDGSDQFPIFNLRPQFGANLAFNHRYIWQPVSRTTLEWTNLVSFNYEDFKSDVVFIPNEERLFVVARSGLQWNYFINYNWRLTLNAGLQYQSSSTEGQSQNVFNPFLNLQTNYAIF